MDVVHGPRRVSPGTYDAWRQILRTVIGAPFKPYLGERRHCCIPDRSLLAPGLRRAQGGADKTGRGPARRTDHHVFQDAQTGEQSRILKCSRHPETGKLKTFLIPDSSVHDPHTMIFDAKGDAWFTAQNAGVVGKLNVADGSIRLWHLDKSSRPYGIVLDAKGRPYFDEFGTNKIGTI